MALTMICLTGPGSTGKSSIIRKFTEVHLEYEKKSRGDVLGIFPLKGYAVGVHGSGDTPRHIRKGLRFLTRYKSLRVIIVSCRKRGQTFEEVKRFKKKANATLHRVRTLKIDGALARQKRGAAIDEKVSEIMSYMPSS